MTPAPRAVQGTKRLRAVCTTCGPFTAPSYDAMRAHRCRGGAVVAVPKVGAPVVTSRGVGNNAGNNPRPGAKTEALMEAALMDAHIYGWLPQTAWCPGRRYKADFLFAGAKVLLEVVGAAHIAGREKLESDMERQAIAASLGYLVVTVTKRTIENGNAVTWLKRALSHAPTSGEGGG